MFKIVLMLYMIIMSQSLLMAGWTYQTSTDEMTGEKSSYASSPSILPTKKIGFPYNNIKSWIGVGCKDGKQWAYFGFSGKPNITNTKPESGYSTMTTRIKIGKDIGSIKLSQDWGSNFIHVANQYGEWAENSFVEKIKEGNSVLLELDWYGSNDVYFKYSLRGSTNALLKMQKTCGYDKILKAKKEEIRKNDKCAGKINIQIDDIKGCIKLEYTNEDKEEQCILINGVFKDGVCHAKALTEAEKWNIKVDESRGIFK